MDRPAIEPPSNRTARTDAITQMRRTGQVILATVAAGAMLGVIGDALGFSGWGYLAGLLVVMVLVSLVDRDGFYGTRHT